jgi:flagellar biogenesis protein FliO
METQGVSEASYWGMVWKTNSTKKEITALHQFILELIEEDKLSEVDKAKYKELQDFQERLAHERLKKKMRKMGIATHTGVMPS